MKELLLHIAERLMRSPAAPYHEDRVASEALKICREHQLHCELDSFGNILVSRRSRARGRPFVLAAHMDHPGFVVRSRTRAGVTAEFLGGVGDSYFKPGVPVRLFPGQVRAELGPLIEGKRHFELRTSEVLSGLPKFAVWDLTEFSLRHGLIRGRVCDDLIGVAAILTVLIQLERSRARAHVIGVLSRAEEVGFHGALALAKSKRLPKDALVISLETSRELPPVQMGRGVIVRVGDRTSIFSSAGTRFLTEVADELSKHNSQFRFQRALMSGGTCEATAYQEFGYECAAVCVALGNYHNCGRDDQVRPEFVSVDDAVSMAELLLECATQMVDYKKYVRRLPARLDGYAQLARRQLKARKLHLNESP